jgi:pimeloyl-[acyl-carrier protein] methyl ester esterase
VKLVLLPGMDGTGRLFTDFIAALGSEFDTLVVSYPRDSSLSYAELEQFARAASPATEPFVLLAESFSTPVAIRWAASAPYNLRGVVLCAGFVSSPLKGLRRLVALSFGRILFRLSPPSFVLRWLLIGRCADSSLLAAIREALSEVKPDVLATRLRSVLNCDERMSLRRLQAPLLFIRPRQDRLIPDWSYEEIRASNPVVEVVEVNGPHLILQTSPMETAKIVSDFVRRNLSP